MGLLNHLFRSDKDVKKELKLDAEKRLLLWREHIENYPKRELLVKAFNPMNIDQTLKDNDKLLRILNELESLVSSELVSIEDEEKVDSEILDDIKKLKTAEEIRALNGEFLRAKKKSEFLIQIFNEMHNFLVVELHIIRTVKNDSVNIKVLLNQLFRLVFFHESAVYHVFTGRIISSDKDIKSKIDSLTKAILLEEKIEEEISKVEDDFVVEVLKEMGDMYSKHEFRILAEDIFDSLVQLVEKNMKDRDDTGDNIESFEKFLNDGKSLKKIIKRKKKKYSEEQINVVAIAFIKSYNNGHFENLEEDYTTK